MPEPKYFDEDTSTPVHGPAIPDITQTAAETYAANEQAMLDALKANMNAVLAVLRSANLIELD